MLSFLFVWHCSFCFLSRYRKLPGDTCVGGFVPSSRKIDLKKNCTETGRSLVKEDESPLVCKMEIVLLALSGSAAYLIFTC